MLQAIPRAGLFARLSAFLAEFRVGAPGGALKRKPTKQR